MNKLLGEIIDLVHDYGLHFYSVDQDGNARIPEAFRSDLERELIRIRELLTHEQNNIIPSIDPEAIYNVKQVALRLDCKLTNVYDLINSRQLAHVPMGAGKKGIRVLGRDIIAFIESRRTGGPKPKSSYKYLKTNQH